MLDELRNALDAYDIFGIPLYDLVLAVGGWVVLGFVLMFVRRQLGTRLEKIAARTANTVDDVLSVAVNATKGYFLWAVALLGGLLVGPLPENVEDPIRKLVMLVALVQLVVWGGALINYWLKTYRERKMDDDPASVTTMQAAALLGKILLIVVAVLLALDNFGVDVTALVAGLGIGGIAVALAVQNILGDLFASLSIILDKPFVVGDFLIVGDTLGSVEKVGLKTTRLRSLSGEQIIVSNSDLLSSRIRNYKRMFERRIVFKIGVVYETKRDLLAQIPDMLREIVESKENVRFDRAHFQAFGDFALTFEVVYFVLVPDYAVYMDIQQAINLEIFQQFEEKGIVFAYPTQMLYVQQTPAE